MIIKTRHRCLVFLAIACTWLSGCSSTNKAYYDTLKLAFSSSDATLTADEVRQSQADLMMVKHGERPAIVMALAYIEDGIYKWVSADGAILSMRDGVIVTTHGLKNDRLFTTNQSALPLTDKGLNQTRWKSRIDVKNYGYGLNVVSQWQRAGNETLSILDNTFDTRVIEEQVTYPDSSPYWNTNLTWTNRYWFNAQNGELLRSEQKFSPVSDLVIMTYLSRAQRYLDEMGEGQ